jgi:DNA-binding transcriptional ArsR family regulator
MSAPIIFISYSHDSDEHAARVRGLNASLSRDGCECRLDVYRDTDEDWPLWMTRQLTEANFILCVVTDTYGRRFSDKELPDVGLGVGWEAGLIRRLLYAKKLHNDRVFPVLFDSADEQHIPLELEGYDFFLLDNPAGYETLLRKVLNRRLYVAPEIGSAPNLESETTRPLFERPTASADEAKRESDRFDISRIIKYAPAELIGRESELEILSDTWDKAVRNEAKRPHILTFVALGGEGKTSLVAKWAAELAHQEWPACNAAFAWSFYSQGTSEKTQASSDSFLSEALKFFDDEETAASAKSSFEKGKRLAQLVSKQRALLILDGVEPLQYAPTSPTGSELKDQGVSALLKALAQNNDGLCVITTRYSIPDLRTFWQTTAPEIKLTSLSNEAGVALLRKLDVKGAQDEFEKLVKDVKGHALTLNLLGSFLRDAHGGDIRKRDLVKLEEADAEEQSGHAFHVMDAYVESFKREGEKGTRALAILRLLGLFDRPATADCLNALWNGEEIGGLTGHLLGLTEAQRNVTLKRLADANLITVNREQGTANLISLDAHPLLREYFAKRVREGLPGAWRAAHRKLYEHLRDTTHEGDEPTLEDLQPLYQAVAHGCQAGLQREVFNEVWQRRIRRGNEKHSIHKLGAFGSDLGAIAALFDEPWKQASLTLSELDRAFLLNSAAYCLRALGRLNEALEPSRAATDWATKKEQWIYAATGSINLSELELLLGEVAEAARETERSEAYSLRTGEPFWKITTGANHADVLHQMGLRRAAFEGFLEAERTQKVSQPHYPLLYSIQGFHYCELLLAASERAAWQAVLSSSLITHNSSLADDCRAVAERTAQTLRWSEAASGVSLLDSATIHLTMGRAALYEALVEGSDFRRLTSDFTDIDVAVARLRRAGTQHHISAGLLTRAWLRFLQAKQTGSESAQEDLDEAWEISERGPMKLHMADIHLYRARLFHTVKPYPWNKFEDGREGRGPKDDLDAAEELINKCGYHRRDEELADAKLAILGKT